MYSTNSNRISETDILRTMTGSNPSQSAVIYGTVKWGTVKWGKDGKPKKKSKTHNNPYMDYYEKKKKKNLIRFSNF